MRDDAAVLMSNYGADSSFRAYPDAFLHNCCSITAVGRPCPRPPSAPVNRGPRSGDATRVLQDSTKNPSGPYRVSHPDGSGWASPLG
jgi:hypothetical protein